MRGDDTNKTPFKLDNITLPMASGDQHIVIQEDQRGALSILADLVMYDGKKSLTYDTGKFRHTKMCYDVWLRSFSFLFKIDNDEHYTALEYLGNVAACLMMRKFYSSKVYSRVYDVSRFVLTPLYFGHLDIVENMIAINPGYLLQKEIPRNIFFKPIRNDSNPVTPFQAVIIKGDIEFLLKIRKYLSGIDEENQFREILVRALENRLRELDDKKNNIAVTTDFNMLYREKENSSEPKEVSKEWREIRKERASIANALSNNNISELFHVHDNSLKTKAGNNTLIKKLFKAIGAAKKDEVDNTIDLLMIDSSPLAMNSSRNTKLNLSEKIRIFYNKYTRLMMSELMFNPYYYLHYYLPEKDDDYLSLAQLLLEEQSYLKTIVVSFIEGFMPASYRNTFDTNQFLDINQSEVMQHKKAWEIYAEISGNTFNLSILERLLPYNWDHPIVLETVKQGLFKIIVKPKDVKNLLVSFAKDKHEQVLFFRMLEHHIYTIICNREDFKELFADVPVYSLLNLLLLVGNHLGRIIKTPGDFACVISYIDSSCDQYFCNIMKPHLHCIITTAQDFIDIFSSHDRKITSILFEQAKYLLSTIIKTPEDFSAVFACLDLDFCCDAFDVLNINRNFLRNIILTTYDIGNLFSKIGDKKCDLVCMELRNQFIEILKTADDCCDAFFLMDEAKREIFYDVLKNHIFTIIKSKNDLDGILNWISQEEGSALIKKLESMAVKKFFDGNDIQNKHWRYKKIHEITLRNIIDYIIPIRPFGFFRSSETDIKKQLEMFGVTIADLIKLDPEKQCRYVLEKINWPENQPVKTTAITPRVR